MLYPNTTKKTYILRTCFIGHDAEKENLKELAQISQIIAVVTGP